jgi:ZIP family zinc transporter
MTAGAVRGGLWKVAGIAWVAFAAMVGGAVVGAREPVRGTTAPASGSGSPVRTAAARRLVWGYGLASGAMVTSAALFLLPTAFGPAPRAGGIGVATGFLAGFAGHALGHRLSHVRPFDGTVAALAAHALAAGAVIGLVYATLPSLGPLLGLAIVSHKAPAGYAAARRLVRAGKDPAVLLVPAAGVGLTAIPAGLLPIPNEPAVNAVVFGFASGLFLHVAADFLPRCEVGGDVHAVAGEDHAFLDRLRLHAAASVASGAVAVVAAWATIA